MTTATEKQKRPAKNGVSLALRRDSVKKHAELFKQFGRLFLREAGLTRLRYMPSNGWSVGACFYDGSKPDRIGRTIEIYGESSHERDFAHFPEKWKGGIRIDYTLILKTRQGGPDYDLPLQDRVHEARHIAHDHGDVLLGIHELFVDLHETKQHYVVMQNYEVPLDNVIGFAQAVGAVDRHLEKFRSRR